MDNNKCSLFRNCCKHSNIQKQLKANIVFPRRKHIYQQQMFIGEKRDQMVVSIIKTIDYSDNLDQSCRNCFPTYYKIQDTH